MIRRWLQIFRTNRVPRKVRDREIRKVMRKLPVFGVTPLTDEKTAFLLNMAKNHSFVVRQRKLYYRYLDGKMSCEKYRGLDRMLGYREMIVSNSMGSQFGVDRKIMARAINTCERRERWRDLHNAERIANESK